MEHHDAARTKDNYVFILPSTISRPIVRWMVRYPGKVGRVIKLNNGAVYYIERSSTRQVADFPARQASGCAE